LNTREFLATKVDETSSTAGTALAAALEALLSPAITVPPATAVAKEEY
jgi:hypothetical protein